MNLLLAARLAVRSLTHHRAVSLATILGIAIGMLVVGAILIVDHNTLSRPEAKQDISPPKAGMGTNSGVSKGTSGFAPDIHRIRVRHQPGPEKVDIELIRLPSQRGAAQTEPSGETLPRPAGAEDYQTMRLAARLASLLAFLVGAIVVFYTMRFSVASREREFSLLLCLGEFRGNVAWSIVAEALMLGVAGTLTGLLLAFPVARFLLQMGISTTGMTPSALFAVPYREMAMMGVLGVFVALLGVWDPIRSIRRMDLAQVLRPRFMETANDLSGFRPAGFAWLIPVLLAASYIAIRPFMQAWLSVVWFFLVEALVVLLLATATLWWVRPLLRGVISLAESILRSGWTLEALLAGRRMRLTAHKLVFTVIGVTLVFSLLTGLHDITRALKHEISLWSQKAMDPYGFLIRNPRYSLTEAQIQDRLKNRGISLFRLSAKIQGAMPMRLAKAADVNPYRAARNRPPLTPGTVIFSTTLAHRYAAVPGDMLEIETGNGQVHSFRIIEVGDDLGFFAENGQYVDLKSYALFSDGNPLFADNLERTLGLFAKIRLSDTDRRRPARADAELLHPHYRFSKWGLDLSYWQKNEINKDFLIFDFILIMTVILAVVGVANTMFIQVHARAREFSVLRTVGCSRWQITRMLLIEGAIIGFVSALLAVVLGNALGAVSISFLDRYTLFDYELILSVKVSLIITALAIAACTVAAILPAAAAYRTSSAESLHYE